MGPIQVECIIFRKKKNFFEFLLLKRIEKKGGFWQPPCGGLENKESIIEAAYREIFEETNISKKDILNVIENVHCFDINKHYITGEPIQPIKEYVLGFEVNPETEVSIFKNVCTEHEKFAWISFEDSIKMLKWDNNKEAFEKLNDLLKTNKIKTEK